MNACLRFPVDLGYDIWCSPSLDVGSGMEWQLKRHSISELGYKYRGEQEYGELSRIHLVIQLWNTLFFRPCENVKEGDPPYRSYDPITVSKHHVHDSGDRISQFRHNAGKPTTQCGAPPPKQTSTQHSLSSCGLHSGLWAKLLSAAYCFCSVV